MIGVSIILYKPSPEILIYLDIFINELSHKNITISIFSNCSTHFDNCNVMHLSNNNSNIGLGAHNKTIDFLISSGCSKVLMLDQDSQLSVDDIYLMSRILDDLPENVILGPSPVTFEGQRLRNQYYDRFNHSTTLINSYGLEATDFVITSGMMLNSSLWTKLGGYEESLFIGDLDVDLCIRNIKQGGSNFRINDIFIKQKIGKGRIGFGPITIVKHEPTRYYYYIRNKIRLIITRKHPTSYIVPSLLYFFAVIITLPWNERRFEVFKMCILGVFHGLLLKSGPFQGKTLI